MVIFNKSFILRRSPRLKNDLKTVRVRRRRILQTRRSLIVTVLFLCIVALETLASQIRSSTGSMKLIEEQLNLRYRTAELAKEGQLEARERLIRDMEEKAKERAELAEAEAFR
jgi:hypothetical protein